MLKLRNSRKRYVAIGEREEQKGPRRMIVNTQMVSQLAIYKI